MWACVVARLDVVSGNWVGSGENEELEEEKDSDRLVEEVTDDDRGEEEVVASIDVDALDAAGEVIEDPDGVDEVKVA